MGERGTGTRVEGCTVSKCELQGKAPEGILVDGSRTSVRRCRGVSSWVKLCIGSGGQAPLSNMGVGKLAVVAPSPSPHLCQPPGWSRLPTNLQV